MLYRGILKDLGSLVNFDYISKVYIIYPKGNKFPEKVNDKNDDDSCDSSSIESEDILDEGNSQSSDLLYQAKKWKKIHEKKSTKSNKVTM